VRAEIQGVAPVDKEEGTEIEELKEAQDVKEIEGVEER